MPLYVSLFVVRGQSRDGNVRRFRGGPRARRRTARSEHGEPDAHIPDWFADAANVVPTQCARVDVYEPGARVAQGSLRAAGGLIDNIFDSAEVWNDGPYADSLIIRIGDRAPSHQDVLDICNARSRGKPTAGLTRSRRKFTSGGIDRRNGSARRMGRRRVTMKCDMIRKIASGKYRLYSRKKDPKTGRRRNLGTFSTRAAAEKHERAVQFFKRR